jgi:transcriptional regulator GlxA family with amidase domain
MKMVRDMCRRNMHGGDQRQAAMQNHRQLVGSALDAIRKRACEQDLRLPDIADSIGTSTWRLSSLLRRLTGKGYWEHLNDQRVLRARSLMVTSDMPVSQIAVNVGYRNVSEFDRHFRQRIGMSPTVWRKNLESVASRHATVIESGCLTKYIRGS